MVVLLYTARVSRVLLEPLQPFVNQRVVVGVSGGADSVALLRALLAVGAEPVVVHFDHALRPESAGDASWVRELAARLGVPFHGVRVEVAVVARKRGWNIEDAARRLRYDFLTRVARQTGAQAILTAHTRRDQAETVLTQLLRGEAVLSGIAAARERIRRPWLGIARQDIETYLHELGQDWREDTSNADPTYNRAWIRQAVMPVLRARYPAAEEALSRVARWSGEDDRALSGLAAQIRPHTPLTQEPPALLRRWVKQQLERAGLEAHVHHLESLSGAIQRGETRHLTLPGGSQVTVSGGQLYLSPLRWIEPDFLLPDGWTLRHKLDGDRIRLLGGTRKVSDLLTDFKIPRAERARLPLLAVGQDVKWLGLDPPVWAAGAREDARQPFHPLDAAMREALTLARQAADADEVPVGAVVMDAQGNIIGRGRNTSREHADMTRHAELAALREASTVHGAYLMDCTLVVTLEPCPMCLGAALEARVGRLVYAASNPRSGALGGVTDLLRAHWGHRLEVRGGYRASEAARLLQGTFRKWREP
ncbi:tRNA lysidine(34) synthetase TilS [Deinococcus cavernae]|uniref:Multifunctional fusion protein n=2 Tax=Deinococcus cavernae TaxID=2320857 RepID=A0A418VC99_9DEIO|nr:tRNA lysidine(34) synthetase TilS [Deinococcus cavernae]RJF73636.1 tRNA lysidine(34) synthetase TilS [Deinococcus cavernae]